MLSYSPGLTYKLLAYHVLFFYLFIFLCCLPAYQFLFLQTKYEEQQTLRESSTRYNSRAIVI